MDHSDDECRKQAAELIAAIDDELEWLGAETAVALVTIAELNAQQAALGYHPNYAAFIHGGIVASRAMTAAHILPLAGLCRLPFEDAIERLAAANVPEDVVCSIVRLRIACGSDQTLELAGLRWLDEIGLLRKGKLDPKWIARPKLGLGQPAKLHGLEPHHRDGHRGLYTLPLYDLRRSFAKAAAHRNDATFGDLLRGVVEAGGVDLAARGADAIRQDAQHRYDEDCRSFAEHQRSTDDRRWRQKQPLSRQGHLAVTTARLRAVDMPAERTRGGAATWLDDHGANARYRKD